MVELAVTVLEPPSSPIESGVRISVTVGASSSSSMVSVLFAGTFTPCELDAPADTVTVLSGASTPLLTAAIATVSVLDVAPAAMVRVVVSLSVKSPATVLAPAAADYRDGGFCARNMAERRRHRA